MTIKATRNSSTKEKVLLKKIRAKSPERKRMLELMTRLKEGMISEEEHSELEKLIDQSEKLQVRKVLAIGRLAKIRNVSVEDLVEELKIN